MLNDDDLVRIFSQKKKDSQIADFVISILGKTLLFSLAVIISYIAINFYGFKSTFQYWYKNDFSDQQPTTNLAEPDVSQLANNTIQTKTAAQKSIQPDMPENSIRIPAISVDAPISWRVNNLPKEVSEGLSKGVIQVNGTALPGEKGNIYITGHSSNYVWVRQQYNSIFSNISKLVVGDIIYVKFGKNVYAYKVFDQRVVAANDLSILNSTNDSRLTLATCWPLGTSLKRMVIIANQIYPNADKNKPSKEVIKFTSLPAGR